MKILKMASLEPPRRTDKKTKAKDDSKNKEAPKTTALKKCFAALVDRKQVNLDIEVLKLMLKHELLINLESLNADLAEVLPLMLVMYIKNWPGWQKSKEYFSGKLNFRDWFEKFRQYIVVRLNFLIKNGYDLALDMIKQGQKEGSIPICNPNKNVKDQGVQTDYLAPKSLAPYSLQIKGPPSLLGSLMFSSLGDDVRISKNPDINHPTLSFSHLLNWPYISVEFISPEIHFKRNNLTEYIRHINLMNSPNTIEKPDFIEEIKIIDSSNGRNCYTVALMRHYLTEYMKILSSVRNIPTQVIRGYKLLCNEFLSDIIDIKMNNTMATNTSVLFNIGRQNYIRSQKPSNSSSTYFVTGVNTEIIYREQVIPKMETSLYYFKGIQDVTTADVSFSYLNILKASLDINNSIEALGHALPILKYRCNFCDVEYLSDVHIISHLTVTHKFEPNLACTKCQNSFPINYLTQTRWKHKCHS